MSADPVGDAGVGDAGAVSAGDAAEPVVEVDEDDAEALYARCQQRLRERPWLVDQAASDLKIRLWACHKQVSAGDCAAAAGASEGGEPGAAAAKPRGPIATAKQAAWSELKGVPRAEAMLGYARTLEVIDPSFSIEREVRDMRATAAQGQDQGQGQGPFALPEATASSSTLSLPTVPESVSTARTEDPQQPREAAASPPAGATPSQGEEGAGPAPAAHDADAGEEEDDDDKKSFALDIDVSKLDPRDFEDDDLDLNLDLDAVGARRGAAGDDAAPDEEDKESHMEWDSDVGARNEDEGRDRAEDDLDDLEDDPDDIHGDDDNVDAEEATTGDGAPYEGAVPLHRAALESIPHVILYKLYELVMVRGLGSQAFAFRGETARRIAAQKQSTAVLVMFSLLPLTLVVYMWTFFLLLFPLTTLPTASYLVWALYLDDSPRTGKRAPWLRTSTLSKHFVDYFPISLTRRGEQLDPERRYVFVYAPHGISALGAFGAFATDSAGFPALFPGIDLRLLTLPQNFRIPLVRELLLAVGMASCSRKSCDAMLRRGPGSAICLVAGGADEALEAEQGTYRLVLKRKGFVRVAVENGADLVPVLAFGETDAYFTLSAEQLGPTFRKAQDWIKRILGFTVPVFWGRLLFMPRRVPIRVVVGEPIRAETFAAQGLRGEALVDAMHEAYIGAVKRLFDEAKGDSLVAIREELKVVG